MTAKRFEMGYDDGLLRFVKDTVTNTNLDIVDCWTVLNELHEKNNELRLQLNLCSDQRNEFHRGARENANRVGKLKEENKQLKHKLDDWHQRTFKAHEYFNILEKIIDEVCDDDVSNQIWKEYAKREKLIE